tara:strand:+ start:2744 stop:6043 length:3300 start_codon:yes stop_codon:yes gene_type:complete
MKRIHFFKIFILSILLFNCNDKIDNENGGTIPLEKLSSEYSGINFSNDIYPNLETRENLFDYDYFYNGSGVGIADLNNDGLKDILFTANQKPNKLYVNNGDLKFNDVTDSSNINQNKGWSSGVTFADINADGWLDIYISQGGPYEKEKRSNILLINNKDLTFSDETIKYGLNDMGISTQSAFFDFDKDGDLDCIVMNENDYYGYDPLTFFKKFENKTLLEQNSSHLYEQIDGKFVNITEKAGLLSPTFGLGLCVSDINNDGWLDIYIANDYYVKDGMYINNQDGTFTNKIKESTKQISFYGMGVDIEDINGDNLSDIFVLDMASSDHVRSKTLMASMNTSNFDLITNKLDQHYQYMFNSLQLNMGNDKYHNISHQLSLAKTDWSWAGLIFDYNLDGNEDIFVTNGYRKYGSDNDSRIKINQTKLEFNNSVPIEMKKRLYEELPSEKLSNLLYKNEGKLSFNEVGGKSKILEPSFSNGASYADLDNDGDLEIIVNNIDQNAFIYKNLSVEKNIGSYLVIKPIGETSETFAKVSIYFDGKSRTKESKRVRGYLSSVDSEIHFGLGKVTKIDSLLVNWSSGKTQSIYDLDVNQTITVKEAKSKLEYLNRKPENYLFEKVENGINFTHSENNYDDFKTEVLLPYKQSTLGPFFTTGDVNNDGMDDIFIGSAKNQKSELFINKSGKFIKKNIKVFEEDSKYEDMESILIDIDNDGDLDLYVVSGGNEFNNRSTELTDRIYINDGNGNYSKDEQNDINNYTISGKTVSSIDYDNDGDNDIIIGNRIQTKKYPIHEPSIIYENILGKFYNNTYNIAPEYENFGIVNKVITTDFNNDGWEDFIAVGEWTNIGLFLNEEGKFRNISKENKIEDIYGLWFNIQETDVNNDGLKDYLIGNIGNNSKYKTDFEKPLKIFGDDFDRNGTHDLVLSYKYEGNYVPLRGKECSTQQMPFISEKIPTFEEFANASIQDIYGEEIIDSYERKVTSFESILLINNGENKFTLKKLPPLAQSIPIITSDVIDINDDGYEDVIIAGNIYNTEVETPRLDNQFALILLSNKINNYTTLGPKETGLYTNGNIKSIKVINNEKPQLLIGNNNSALEIFELKK